MVPSGELVMPSVIAPHISGQYPLAEVAKAHADLEGGRSSGAIVLNP